MRLITAYKPEILRPSPELPEVRLLVHMIRRAVRDYQLADATSLQDAERERFAEIMRERGRAHEIVWRRWQRSRLSVNEYCAITDITPAQIQKARMFLVAHGSFKPCKKYVSASDWLFSNSDAPFSFRWAVTQIYGDAEPMTSKIRKALLQNRAALSEQEAA